MVVVVVVVVGMFLRMKDGFIYKMSIVVCQKARAQNLLAATFFGKRFFVCVSVVCLVRGLGSFLRHCLFFKRYSRLDFFYKWKTLSRGGEGSASHAKLAIQVRNKSPVPIIEIMSE
jgi:hypothetical protein